MKDSREALIGDTICHTKCISKVEPLPGLKPAKPMASKCNANVHVDQTLCTCTCTYVCKLQNTCTWITYYRK